MKDVHGRYRAIGGYALIGDCRSAALVSRDGSIDWLCLPRFDSPSLFAAILDAEKGGSFSIRPAGEFQVERRYLPGTNVLEMTFHTAGGTLVLRDLMPVASEEEKSRELTPDHEILRELEGVEGEVEVEIFYAPRPDYGRRRLPIVDRGRLGMWSQDSDGAMILSSDIPLRLSSDCLSASGRAAIRAGDRAYLAFTYAEDGPAVLPPLGADARRRIDRTAAWWREWSARCTYEGPYRDVVVRSALTLKLMTYAPSGALIAAPTTSLPERIGGPRNWDYRYCWLRDASFTVRSLWAIGYAPEAEAFLGWMLYVTRLTSPELQVIYDVYGNSFLPETELTHLAGYGNSQPVRIGNDAHGQLQLDIYGEVLDAVGQFASHDGRFDGETVRLLDGLGRTVCRRWREPDEGIWEGRSGRHQHTHSKILCWVALNCLIDMHDRGQIAISHEEFRKHRDAIRDEIESRGYNEALGAYTRTLDGDELDASLLTIPLYGYAPASDPRVRSTIERIRRRLGDDALVYRYAFETDDGLQPGEAAFGICSFWAVECRKLLGDDAGATRDFEKLLSYANDVGLFAEEIDPETGDPRGNFPQAFTHVGLINAALTLAGNLKENVDTPRPSIPALNGDKQ